MSDDFIIIAHRGASGRYPENTLLAFAKALEAGATWLELDVHLSADDQLVVIHDATLQRTSNGFGPVRQHLYAELRQLNAGAGEPIPLLQEVLDLAAGKARVNIELKGRGTGQPVAELLHHRLLIGLNQPEDFLASSLYERELILFAEQLPQVPLAPVVERPGERSWQLAGELKAWSLHVEKGAVSGALLERAREKGLRLLAYTVNSRTEVERLKELGVDGVFTDYPERFGKANQRSFRGG